MIHLMFVYTVLKKKRIWVRYGLEFFDVPITYSCVYVHLFFESIPAIPVSDLKRFCINLQVALTGPLGSSDISGHDLFKELNALTTMVTSDSSLGVLDFIFQNHLENIFPNAVISLKILLTLPITVASGERSFSKLKLIN